MRPDQERVSTLLLDTVTLLCRNGLTFKNKLTVQGLIGITVDSEVFIVHINENIVEEHSYNYDELSKTPAQSFQISAGERVPNLQFVASCSTGATTKSQTKNREIHHNPNAPESLYDHSTMGSLGDNDIIDIKSEGEEDEVNSNFKQNISHHSLILKSENVQFQQTLGANKLAYGKRQLNETEARTDNGSFDPVQPKMELNYNYSMTGSYATFSGSEEQDLNSFVDGDQQDYLAMGEEYADEEALEEDEKPDPDVPSTSFSSWEQQHRQFATNRHPLRGRRSAAHGPKKTANRRMMEYNMHTRLEVEHFSCNSSQVAKLGRLETNSVQRTPPPSTSSMPFTSHSKVIFCCDLCGQPFTAKSNLLRHQILKHGRQKMKRGRPPNNGY